MFTVKTPAEAEEILRAAMILQTEAEELPLSEAADRVLAEPYLSDEDVPAFDRSTVDGYAVKSADTFGCSDSLPALLAQEGEVRMGEAAMGEVHAGSCVYVPTGGELPAGADAVVMVEYTEDYGDGTIGILRPCAPGENVIFRGDDIARGQELLPAGFRLRPQEIGALASLGRTRVRVRRKVRVGILSTGDELVRAEEKPGPGQIRDVNSALLAAMVLRAGAEPVLYGIVPDRREELKRSFAEAVRSSDLVLLTGGSSVGVRDLTCSIIEEAGRILFHGLSMKPGKPTIFGLVKREGGEGREVPVFGLPGHPGAAFFVTEIFIRPRLLAAAGLPADRQIEARLVGNLGANHGRAQYMAVLLEREEGALRARPVHSKSGLLSGMAGADGYFCIPGDTEGLPDGSLITVTLF